MKEFFGFGGYTRKAEGFFSWQHVLFCSLLMVVMVLLAVFFGLKNRKKTEKEKNRVLIAAALMIDGFELFKIVLICCRDGLSSLSRLLPLFLCSIPLFVLPIAAFGKGKLREMSLDFLVIFGLLVAFLGTYGAGNNYSVYPVLCFDNVVSGITHAISGFSSLYLILARMVSMKKKTLPLTFAGMVVFCGVAYLADVLIPYNYMFLIRDDGTPYSIFYRMVNGHPVFYPLIVVGLFLVCIAGAYGIVSLARRKKAA